MPSKTENIHRSTINRGLLMNLTLAAFSIIVVLAIAEIAIRTFDLFSQARGTITISGLLDENVEQKNDAATKLLIHPYLGWSRRPGLVWSMPKARTDWTNRNRRTNFHGFNSEIYDYRDLSETDFVVGIFGGSVANGLSLWGGDAVITEIEKRRPELIGSVRLINFGLGGYKQPQQLILFELMLLLGVPFDTVINIDGFNEVALGGTDVKIGQHPLFASRYHFTNTFNLARGTSTREEILLSAEALSAGDNANIWGNALANHSLIVHSQLLRAVFGSMRLFYNKQAIHLEERIKLLDRPQSMVELDDSCLDKNDDCLALITKLWQNCSRMMATIANAAGIDYLHLLQPNQYVEGSKTLSNQEHKLYYRPQDAWSAAAIRGYPHLIDGGEKLRQEGIKFHDMTRIFFNHPETIYRDRCCHYNWHGNQILGSAVGALVAEAIEVRDVEMVKE